MATCTHLVVFNGSVNCSMADPMHNAIHLTFKVTTSGTRTLAAPLLGPRGPGSDPQLPLLDHRGDGRLRSAPRARGPQQGFYPARGPCLATPHVGSCGAQFGSPVSLPLTTVAAAAFAPLRKRAAPPPGVLPRARPPPRHFTSRPGPRGPGSDPLILPIDLRVALRARGPAGPAATTQTLGCDHLRGDVCSAPGHLPPGGWGGTGGGRAPIPASAMLARCRRGSVWD
jgi:hypothetical protein